MNCTERDTRRTIGEQHAKKRLEEKSAAFAVMMIAVVMALAALDGIRGDGFTAARGVTLAFEAILFFLGLRWYRKL